VPEPTSAPALVARGLAKAYRSVSAVAGATIRVLDGLDLKVEAGESVAIQGESGIGKTTLLNLLGGLDRPDAGEILHAGEPIPRDLDARAKWRRGAVGFIFQFHGLLAELTALENVALAGLVCGWSRDEAHRAGEELLERVGLAERMEHHPDELSGGEQQRVARSSRGREPFLPTSRPATSTRRPARRSSTCSSSFSGATASPWSSPATRSGLLADVIVSCCWRTEGSSPDAPRPRAGRHPDLRRRLTP
jgi:predicted ABC-type transport system involved in lysophospholipase L1 biosynthesis ATPase subunit